MLSNIAAPTLLKVCAGLAIALAASAWLNVEQAFDIKDAKEDCEARITTMQSESIIAGKDAALAYSRGFAAAAAQEDARIEQRLTEIAQQQDDVLRRYRQRLALLTPLPADCGPGAERVQYFNEWPQ